MNDYRDRPLAGSGKGPRLDPSSRSTGPACDGFENKGGIVYQIALSSSDNPDPVIGISPASKNAYQEAQRITLPPLNRHLGPKTMPTQVVDFSAILEIDAMIEMGPPTSNTSEEPSIVDYNQGLVIRTLEQNRSMGCNCRLKN